MHLALGLYIRLCKEQGSIIPKHRIEEYRSYGCVVSDTGLIRSAPIPRRLTIFLAKKKRALKAFGSIIAAQKFSKRIKQVDYELSTID